MTNLLLDSHVLLWWLGNQKLTPEAQTAIDHPETTAFASAASAWELEMKAGLGRLDMPEDLGLALAEEGFSVLPITLPHTTAVRDLPWLHRDPFDRMLVAQAQVERLTLVTRDEQLMAYDVAALPA